MRFVIDWETDIDPYFSMQVRPVVLAVYETGSTEPVLLSPEEAKEWFLRLGESDVLAAHNAAFDLTKFVPLVGLSAVMERYLAGKVLCSSKAAYILLVAAGTPKLSISLAACYERATGESINSKGGDHPILGASSGVKEEQKLTFFRLLAEHRYKEAFNIVPLEEVPARYLYSWLTGLPFELWPEKFIEYAKADTVEACRVMHFLCLQARSIEIPSMPQLEPLEGIPDVCLVQGGSSYVEQYNVPRHTAFESAADFCLWVLKEIGIFTDADYCAEMRRWAEEVDSKIGILLLRKGYLQLSEAGWGADTKALREMVREAYAEFGLTPPLTDKGYKLKQAWERGDTTNPPETWPVSIAGAVLDECPGKWPLLYKTWSTANRLLQTTLPSFEGGVVKTAFNSCVVTSRVSSGTQKGGGREINSQNIKSSEGIQEAIVPPSWDQFTDAFKRIGLSTEASKDELCIVSADYASLELWPFCCKTIFNRCGIWGYVPGISALADDLMSGVDVHSKVGCQLLAYFEPDHPAANNFQLFAANKKKDPACFHARHASKTTLYGAIGLMFADTLARQAFSQGLKFAVTPEGLYDPIESKKRAEATLKVVCKTYPEIESHRRAAFSSSQRYQDTVALPQGWLRGQCEPTELGNMTIQPPAARCAKTALIMLTQKMCERRDFLVYMFVHDSFALVCPVSIQKEIRKMLEDTMHLAKDYLFPRFHRDDHVVALATDRLFSKPDPAPQEGVVRVPTLGKLPKIPEV